VETVQSLLARLRGQRVYLDTNGLIYFFDNKEPYFSLMVEIIKACDRGDFFGFTGDAAVAELMVHPYRSCNAIEIARGKAFFARKNFITVLGHGPEVFDTAARLRATDSLKLIDALHYATATHAGCRYFLTHDKDFNALESNETVQVIRLTQISG
jgi:predicted nucleic acid-binding protein